MILFQTSSDMSFSEEPLSVVIRGKWQGPDLKSRWGSGQAGFGIESEFGFYSKSRGLH